MRWHRSEFDESRSPNQLPRAILTSATGMFIVAKITTVFREREGRAGLPICGKDLGLR